MSITQQPPPAGHPVPAALRGIDAALSAALDRDVAFWSLSNDELTAALDAVEVAARRVYALSLRLVREADGRGLAKTAGAASTASWLRDRLALHPGEAKRRVTLAAMCDLDGGECAATGRALAAGAVSGEQARIITDTIAALESPQQGAVRAGEAGLSLAEIARVSEDAQGVRADAEATLLGHAATFGPTDLAKTARHLQHVADLDRGDDLAIREERQLQRRELTLGAPAPDGTIGITGRLDGESGALFAALLEPLAAPRPAGPEGPDTRTPARRRGDALAELLAHAARTNAMITTGDSAGEPGTTGERSTNGSGGSSAAGLGTAGGERPHLTVTVTLDTLERRLGAAAADLDFGLPISAVSARRLACDARIIPIVLGTQGQPLDVGRAAYTVPTALRRALIARDRGCAFPGCDQPPTRCDAHHCTHWADGGHTALCNLVLLCGHHHRLIHTSHWHVHINPADGHPEFTPPPWIDRDREPIRPTRLTLTRLLTSRRQSRSGALDDDPASDDDRTL